MRRFVVRFHFEAVHYLSEVKGPEAARHGHTFYVTAWFRIPDLIPVVYRDFERMLRIVCGEFDHNVINELPPFDTVEPTAEALAQYIFEGLEARVHVFRTKVNTDGVEVQKVSLKEGEYAEAEYLKDSSSDS